MNKYQKLATNTLLFSIGSFGSKILSVLLIRLYTGILTVPEISTTELFTQTANLLIPIATLRISEGVMRYGMSKEYSTKQVYTTGVLTTLVGLCVTLLFFPLLGLIPDLQGYMLLMGVYLFTASFRELNQYHIRAKGHIKLFTVDGIITTLMLLLFNVLFLVVLKLGINGYILSIICADGFSVIFTTIFGKTHKDIKIKGLSKDVVQSMTRYSIPLIPTFILWWIVGASDRYMVRYMIDAQTNGMYSMAYKIPTLISIASTIFYQAWQMSAITEYNTEGARQFYSKIFNAYQSMMYIASAGILMLLKPLTAILIAPKMQESYVYAPLLVIGVLMSCFCQFLSSIYSAAKKTKNSMWTSLIAAALNIILNLSLIPILGAQGSAIATMFSYFACFIVRLIDTRRYIEFDIDWKKIIFNLVILLLMSGVLLFGIPVGNLILIVLFGGVVAASFDDIVQTIDQLVGGKLSKRLARFKR